LELGGEIMVLVQVKSKGQITVPHKIREELGVKEGDYLGLDVDIQSKKIVMIPQVVLDKFPSVELSKKGKKMIEEALKELKTGKVKKFKNVKELIAELHK